jgi:hypothetical protein
MTSKNILNRSISMNNQRTREEWLEMMKDELTNKVFEPAGYTVPTNIRVTCGFPSKNALSKKNKRIGEIWSAGASAGKMMEILIHPQESDSVSVGAILAHEMTHGVIGVQDGHKRTTFGKCARAIDLQGALTATCAGEKLTKTLEQLIEKIGKYPHATLYATTRERKDHCRYIKIICPDCDFYALVSRKHTEHLPTCHCGAEMVIDPKHQNPADENIEHKLAANT